MVLRILVSALLLGIAGSALAAPAKQKPAAQAPQAENASIVTYTPYDSLIDPFTASIRKALSEFPEDGDFVDKRDRAAVVEFYSEQGYAPAWTKDGVLTEKARAIVLKLGKADEDGLDPRAYRTPPIGLGKYVRAGTETLGRADVSLSLAIAAYVRNAYAGRLEPSKVSPNFGYEPHLPDAIAALTEIAGAADPVAAIEAYNPPHEQFKRLRAKLAELRKAEIAEKPVEVPPGATLKPGMTDPRVPVLRARLDIAAPVAAETADLYDDTLVEAVKTFQKSAGLKPDGMVGKGTLGVLNRAPVDPVPVILANMERWRWMPRDLGKFYVQVSIPDFQLDVMRNGVDIHSTRIVVGKVQNQTPIFSDEIEHIIVNPAWNVPASITKKEMLPAAQANPASLSGYEVFYNFNGRYRQIDPSSVDWYNVDVRRVQIRQPPGERNALGNIKFMFPNPYDVYLHDTPSKSLFQRDYRAFSHGCMRVMDPMAFADALLVDEPDFNAAKLKKMVGGPEKLVKLARHVPVHITYFTASVGDDGNLKLRDDLYGHDKTIEAAFGLL
jgi:murein L,D-transpeptidase YcbB/YkuD